MKPKASNVEFLLRAWSSQPKHQARYRVLLDEWEAWPDDQGFRKVDQESFLKPLNMMLDKIWEKEVQEPYFFGGAYESLPADVREALGGGLYQVNHIPSVLKKIKSCKTPHESLDKAQQVLDACAWMLEVRDWVKKHPVAKKSTEELAREKLSKLAEEQKVLRTCSCCAAIQGVMPSGLMAKHGYTRPGDGRQTEGCEGGDQLPWETSPEGLKRWIQQLQDSLPSMEATLAQASQWGGFFLPTDRGPKHYTPASPHWAKAVETRKRQLEEGIRATRQALPELEQRLGDWKLVETRDVLQKALQERTPEQCLPPDQRRGARSTMKF